MIRVSRLESGIRLVTEKIPYVNSISTGVWIGTGASSEEPKYSGISHFTEHMMFKGTENRTALDIAEEIDRIGGQMNAFTGKEATCYYVKTTDDMFERAADVLVDMLTHSLFAAKELNKERKVILEEINMSQDDPDTLSMRKATDLVFRGRSLGNSVLGNRESLELITSEVMHEYVRNNYTAENMVISVAGNFSEKKVRAYFEKAFSSFKRERKKYESEDELSSPSRLSIIKDIEQTHISMATEALPLGNKDYYAMCILNDAMGGNMSSRFFQNIREDRGLAYSVYSMYGAYTFYGSYLIYAGISSENLEEVISAICDELRGLDRDGLDPDELEASRAQIKSAYLFSQESSSGRMYRNGKNVLLLGRAYDSETLIKGYDSVTLDDIDRVKKLICDVDSYSAVVISNKSFPLDEMMQIRK